MRTAARMPPLGIASALALLAGVSTCLWSPGLLAWPLSAVMAMAGAWWWFRGACWRLAAVGPPGPLPRDPPVRGPLLLGPPLLGALLLGPLLLGFGLAGLHAAHALAMQLPLDWERRDVLVSGRITDLPQQEPRGTRFTFRVDTDAEQPAPLRGQTLRLAWYDEGSFATAGAAPAPSPSVRPTAAPIRGSPPAAIPAKVSPVKAGQRWRLPVRVRAPRGLRNPGGFDSEKYALAQRIAATGYVREPERATRLSAATGLQAWREAVSTRIARSVPAPSSRFVRALALGDTRALQDGDWATLRANGLTHLIAISGFHVGLVAGFFALLARGLWWLWPALSRRCPAPIVAALAGLAGGLAYAAVAGFALPTVRTVLMIAVVAGARTCRRPLRSADALALSMLVVLLVDPLAVLAAGFWLSFLGVAWLLWCLPHGTRNPLRELVSAQAVATLGLLPMTAILFGQASLAGPLANLIAVPWWSLVVVPLSLIGMAVECLHAGAGAAAWRAAAWCFDRSWPLFEWLASSGLALWWLPEPRWFAMPLALLGAFWLLLPRGVPGKPLALLLWLPLLWPDRHLPAHGEAELVVIDVGQGLSVLVRTAHHTLLYDMGPAVRDGFDAGERAVVPTLRALGVRRLDRAVASHADNDHVGGLPAVRLAYPIADALAPEGSRIAASRPCVAGEAWTWDSVHFRFLHPPPFFPYLKNESSCVLRIEAGRRSALLTGDIGDVIERELLHRDVAGVRVDVVVVAHHGSGGSSDPAFVAATGARHALISTGHGNRFQHPREEVVQRWRQAGAATWDTAQAGAVRVRLGAGPVQPETRRQAQRTLWDAAARTGPARAGLSYRPD